MKQILLSLLLLCSLGVSAQDVVVTRQRKQQTTTSKSKAQNKATVPSPTIGTSTYTPHTRAFTANGVSFQMIEVRGGTFKMGATSEQDIIVKQNPKDYEKRDIHLQPRIVSVKSFYIGQFEVTQKLWKAVMGSNPSNYQSDMHPVENVNYNDCIEFIRRLNGITGVQFRCPTEEEWEFAARGGTKSKGYKYSGSNNLSEVAYLGDNNNSIVTGSVGSKKPNELGIYDMSGNVWEFCSSDYLNAHYSKPDDYYITRGGSIHNADFCKTAEFSYQSKDTSFRDEYSPTIVYSPHGLRLALSE